MAMRAAGFGLSGVGQMTGTQQPTPGSPPTYGIASPVGPEVTVATFAEAEKLVQAPVGAGPDRSRKQLAASDGPGLRASRCPGKLIPRNDEAPTTARDPTLGVHAGPTSAVFGRSTGYEAALPKGDGAIAFATVAQLPDGSR